MGHDSSEEVRLTRDGVDYEGHWSVKNGLITVVLEGVGSDITQLAGHKENRGRTRNHHPAMSASSSFDQKARISSAEQHSAAGTLVSTRSLDAGHWTGRHKILCRRPVE